MAKKKRAAKKRGKRVGKIAKMASKIHKAKKGPKTRAAWKASLREASRRCGYR